MTSQILVKIKALKVNGIKFWRHLKIVHEVKLTFKAKYIIFNLNVLPFAMAVSYNYFITIVYF